MDPSLHVPEVRHGVSDRPLRLPSRHSCEYPCLVGNSVRTAISVHPCVVMKAVECSGRRR